MGSIPMLHQADKRTVRMLLANLEYTIKLAVEAAVTEATAPGELTLPPGESHRVVNAFKRSWFKAASRVRGQQGDGLEQGVEGAGVELLSRGGRRVILEPSEWAARKRSADRAEAPPASARCE